jgi:hypothetical protein
MLLRPADDGGDDDESLGLPLLLLLGGVLAIFLGASQLYDKDDRQSIVEALAGKKERGTAGARSSSYVYGEREALGRQQGQQMEGFDKYQIQNHKSNCRWLGWMDSSSQPLPT